MELVKYIHHLTLSARRSGWAMLATAALASTLPAGGAWSAEGPQPGTALTQGQLTIETESAMTPMTGDLDSMIERRVIRVLTTHSKTFFFIDKGTPRGTTADLFRLFEEDLNKQLAKEKQLKHKHLKVKVVFIPVARGDLLQALTDGKGDVAAANLTITEERSKQVDFSVPLGRNVSELLISGPASPRITSLDDLAGKEVFVRRSSSYYQSLTELNRRFADEKRPAVVLKEAPDALEDEDLLEMLNAGLISLIVVDSHKAAFWQKIFPKIEVHDDIASADWRRDCLGDPQGESTAQSCRR